MLKDTQKSFCKLAVLNKNKKVSSIIAYYNFDKQYRACEMLLYEKVIKAKRKLQTIVLRAHVIKATSHAPFLSDTILTRMGRHLKHHWASERHGYSFQKTSHISLIAELLFSALCFFFSYFDPSPGRFLTRHFLSRFYLGFITLSGKSVSPWLKIPWLKLFSCNIKSFVLLHCGLIFILSFSFDQHYPGLQRHSLVHDRKLGKMGSATLVSYS